MGKQHPSNSGTDLGALFTYHPPNLGQTGRYGVIRDHARSLAAAIMGCCPDCADRSAAIRKVREAMMTANAAIALETYEPVDDEAQQAADTLYDAIVHPRPVGPSPLCDVPHDDSITQGDSDDVDGSTWTKTGALRSQSGAESPADLECAHDWREWGVNARWLPATDISGKSSAYTVLSAERVCKRCGKVETG